MGSCIWQCVALAKRPNVNSRVGDNRCQKVERKGGRERERRKSEAGRSPGGGPAECGWSTSGARVEN